MGILPDFRTFPPDDLLGLFTCQREYLQGYKTSKIASVAICGRSCHIMPVLNWVCVVANDRVGLLCNKMRLSLIAAEANTIVSNTCLPRLYRTRTLTEIMVSLNISLYNNCYVLSS